MAPRSARLAWLLLAAACGPTQAQPPPLVSFIAFARDFDNFRAWESFTPGWATGLLNIHQAGDRKVYLSARPQKASKVFPVGTRIVKTVDGGTKIFAMAKRGDGYNAEGAVGWEWFELTDGSGGAVSINWRGLGPPAGEGYFGDPSGSCNVCHGAAKDNDFVHPADLKLSDL